MRSNTDEGELMGPGMDLAMSLSGILMIVVFATVAHLWLVSSANRRSEAANGVSASPIVEDKERRIADLKEQLRAASARAEQLEDQISEIRAGLDKSSDQVNAVGRRVTELERALASRDAELTSARRLDVLLKKEKKDAEAALAAATKEATELKIKLEGENKRSKEQLEAKLNEITAWIAELGREKQRNSVANTLLRVEKKKRETTEADLQSASQRITGLLEQVKILQKKLNDKPPLITISDAKFRTFEQGSAEISPALKNYLRGIVPGLYSLRNQYGAKVIEVVGHTDEVPVGTGRPQICNLDDNLLDGVNGRKSANLLEPCDNVGLGMARAAAVVNELRNLGLGVDFILLPLSAGQAIDTDGTLAAGVQAVTAMPARRRIEIRLRRPDE